MDARAPQRAEQVALHRDLADLVERLSGSGDRSDPLVEATLACVEAALCTWRASTAPGTPPDRERLDEASHAVRAASVALRFATADRRADRPADEGRPHRTNSSPDVSATPGSPGRTPQSHLEGKMERSEKVDIVIVGGGMAGLAVAAELSASRAADVVVLEAGPDGDREHYRWSADEPTAMRQWLDPTSDPHFWRPYATDGVSYAGISGLRRRMGGRSLYWHGVTLPIENWALESWPVGVTHDLTAEWLGGPSLYHRVSEELTKWSGYDITDPPGTGRRIAFGDYEFGPVPQAVVSRADGRWQAYSPLGQWKDGGKPRLVPDCRVLGVIISDGRAVGVRAETESGITEFRADRVVLAGGTVENSRLAIQALTEVGWLTEPRLPGLVDKVVHGFNANFDLARLSPELADAAREHSYGITACASGLRSNTFLALHVNPHGTAVLDAWVMGEQIAGEAAYVEARPAPAWPWPTSVVAGLSDIDEKLRHAQQTELQRLWSQFLDAAGADRQPLAFAPEFGSPDLQELLLAPKDATGPTEARTYSFQLGSEQHEGGTTPFGTLLDDDHQFHGVPGMYAAGPSTFPRSGAANPALTILALAKRLAHRLS
ncbi:oxidoreductase [Micromonospora schwarzwaldensis]